MAVVLGLFLAMSARAASLQLVPNWGASGVPTNLSMYAYVPDNVAPNPPILVLLHYWGGTAASVFGQAQAGGIVAAADQYGFIMVVPQRSADCWDSGSTQALTHDGGGETHGIAQMVRFAITNYHANADRVYVTGDSCGAMMTEAMLAVYPDLFKAGVAFASQSVGGAWTPITHTAQEWGDIVRGCYPGYSGPRPRVQLWHGTADGTISYSNQVQSIAQWGNVLGLSVNPTTTATGVKIGSITNDWTHQVWVDACGHPVLDAWSEIGGTHDIGALFNAQYVIPFLGLDKLGPVDPGDPDVYCGNTQRGRPQLNAARTSFVGDNGERLRGPYTSTEWTPASQNVAMIKGMGFNALHLYAEAFDKRYPTNGSTAPGYAVANVDSIVAQTRTNGLYLIMTIGNGAWNGDYNAAYITNFWKFYAQRYANETHVLFEIQNEPVAWGPPYSSPTATPPGALDMEVATYKIIRQYAPNTPVLLFTYAVLGDSGGASAALTDIHAFNTNVFGTANVAWTNEAVGFHGYAGAVAMSNAVSQIIAAGYPCFMTEFAGGVWGTGVPGLDAYGVADLERLGVSWLTFQYIPPTGVSDDVSKPKHYADIVKWSGLSWTPDFGNYPAVRGPYGNGGYPWTTPGYANNALTGSLRIQAENFDSGGEGIAYHDLTVTNLGGQYRTSEAVDIETTTDTGGGYDVTSTSAGEWLEYTIYVSEPGFYNLALRVAGASAGSVRVLTGGITGTNLTGNWTVPATGGAQTWTTISNTVFLTPGQQVLHLDVLSGGFNLNWLQLSPVTTGNFAGGSYKLLNAASALAVTGVSSSNKVVAASYTGTSAQKWNLQHIGGGQYKITSVENGWSLTSGGFYFWIDKRYFVQPTGDGYYRLVPSDSGFCFETTVADPSVVGEKVSSGGVNQRWAIVAPTAPAFPTGLTAVAAGSTAANLAWNAVAGATTYNVKRATNSGGAYTTVATGVTTTNYTDTTLSSGVKYFYVVSAVAGGVESLNSGEAPLTYPKLNGAIIGTAGSWGNSGNTIAKVFDGNFSTFFDAPDPGNGDWAGLDFGAGVSNVVTQINYCPRSGFESRMTGGVFQGANQSNFSDAITLFTVATSPSSGAFTSINITNATAFRYVRFLSPNGGYGNVAELEFYGYPFANPVSGPAGLSAVAVSSSQINLIWNALTNATSYNLKRSTTNGGPYSVIASGVTATNYADTGLAAGTTYYYVVSAMVSANETPNSTQASAATPAPLVLLGRWVSGAANFIETSGYSPAGTFDGFAVAGSYYFTNDVPPNATGVSVRLNNCGIGITNTSAAWDANYTNTFDQQVTNSFTVACWAKGWPAGWNPWVSKYGESGRGWQLRTDGSATTYPCWTIRNGGVGTVTLGTAVYGNPDDLASRSIAIGSDGQWHHYAGTFDAGTGARNLYVDGELAAAETGNTVYNLAVTNRLMLGARDNGSSVSSSGGYGNYFTGNLYDVRIYNLAASQAQVRSLAGLMPPPLTNQVAAGQVVLTWSWGTLMQATNLPGPWTPVPVASPYTNSPVAPQMFFRVSNP